MNGAARATLLVAVLEPHALRGRTPATATAADWREWMRWMRTGLRAARERGDAAAVEAWRGQLEIARRARSSSRRARP